MRFEAFFRKYFTSHPAETKSSAFVARERCAPSAGDIMLNASRRRSSSIQNHGATERFALRFH
jgi:hypothetical protein